MCHEYDSRDSGYRWDRRWMRGEDHGNPLPSALLILTWKPNLRVQRKRRMKI